MKRVTIEEFKRKYGENALEGFTNPVTPTEQGFLSRVGTSIGQRFDKQKEILGETIEGKRSLASGFFGAAGQGAGMITDPLTEAVGTGLKATGLDKPLGSAIGAISESKALAKVADVTGIQAITDYYMGSSQEVKDNIDAVFNIGSLIPAGALVKPVVGAVKTGTLATTKAITETTAKIATETFELGKKILPKSPEIMNRVARLTPTQARKFKDLAGESHGEYLTKTGNFGNPQQIVEKEAIKFSQSIKSVDEAFDKLEGVYKAGVIDDVLEGLQKKVVETSTKNVPSPISARVSELVAKNAGEGLSMKDINTMKRLYEREVKLGFNKMTTPSNDITRATNIDNALREWQVIKAEELGFTNLRELNKQTQISKNLINSLGDEVVGKTGLNNVNLTDWIMLSGGDPTAVVGFLTKKFFSSKNIQSRIAGMLSGAKLPEGIIKPKINSAKQILPL